MSILTVGPDGQFSTIGDAIAASQNGDVILVQGGTYTNDFAKITDNITLQAMGGRVDMVATTAPLNDKGIFIIGDATHAPNVTINGFDFEDAQISAKLGGDGAGIRYQSGNLTLSDDLFVHNQDGLLATPFVAGAGTITIDHSEFGDNGSGTGFTHNLYVGVIGSLTITNSYFHDVSAGHEIKSRAEANTIENNRVFDLDGTASYSIDLPNGGQDIVAGNTIEKGLHSENHTSIITYYEATGTGVPQIGSDQGHWTDSQLTVTGNTFVNDLPPNELHTAIWNNSTMPVAVSNNSFFNVLPAGIVSGPADISGSTFLATEPVLNTSDPFACFAAGTRILTATGERTVENLTQRDVVLTLSDNELSPQHVKWIGRRRIDLTAYPRPEVVAPVRIQRGAFADNVPHSDLLLSPDHAIFVDGKLICARQLINRTTIRQEKDLRSIEYFHIELDAHAILLSAGLPVESYLNTGNQGFFVNSGEPLVLHPDLTDESDYPTREAGSCAPFVWDEASVQPVWQRLADRAAAIGQPVPQRATTTEANLRVGGKKGERNHCKPLHADSNLVLFVLPRGEKEFRLISRAQSPTEARPWLEDCRKLGVRVKRIVLRGADELHEIPLDHPSLTKGWWAVERDGQVMSRWTDGDAVLPLPERVSGDVILEIHLAGAMTYVVEAERVAA